MAKQLLEVAPTPAIPEASMERARIREILVNECEVDSARAGGKGGQNVNKVSSKAVLVWYPETSRGFTDAEKRRLMDKLQGDITEGGYIRRTCSNGRDFHRNLATAYDRFAETIWKALQAPKERIATEVPKSADQGRINNKKKEGEKKAERQTGRNWRDLGDD